ncbi:eukaryotic translation initiation factor 5-like [Telopea speciosissima]|uniref:eukaryotic translation initiation factor 5-like n=1 Tax=Telopea speciosissima TaxID=54955 RepID=UPI001CC4C1F4|nr:eukaryotic translation initiation factor 5-like [Telopea speciosissima]
MNALFEALFEGVGKGFGKEVAKKKSYLAAATGAGSQMFLLWAIEDFCGKSSPEVVKVLALALKALYGSDVLEEETIVQWYQEGLAGGSTKSHI